MKRRYIMTFARNRVVILAVLALAVSGVLVAWQFGSTSEADQPPLPEIFQRLEDRGVPSPDGSASWEGWFADATSQAQEARDPLPTRADQVADLITRGNLPAEPPDALGYASWEEFIASVRAEAPSDGPSEIQLSGE